MNMRAVALTQNWLDKWTMIYFDNSQKSERRESSTYRNKTHREDYVNGQELKEKQ